MEKILFEYINENEEYALESAWAVKEGDFYKLDNILFYAPNYSLGDIVKVENRNRELYVTDLIRESGHSTVRVIFYHKKYIFQVTEWVLKIGCRYEGSNIATLISVDIPPNIEYSLIKEFLEKGEKEDKWSYQEACIAHKV